MYFNDLPLNIVTQASTACTGQIRHPVLKTYQLYVNLAEKSTLRKVVVAGVVQRKDEARLQVIDDRTREVLHDFIRKYVANNAEAIYRDDWPSYNGIADEDTRHETVNRSESEWVRGEVHTNYVENIWSLLKRSLVGSYHKVSKKHLDAYLDELEWRFNNRENPYLFRDTLLKLIKSGSLEYKKLITS